MLDLKKEVAKIANVLSGLDGDAPEGGTKYHQQAQARGQKRTSYRADLDQNYKTGLYPLTPEKVVSKES